MCAGPWSAHILRLIEGVDPRYSGAFPLEGAFHRVGPECATWPSLLSENSYGRPALGPQFGPTRCNYRFAGRLSHSIVVRPTTTGVLKEAAFAMFIDDRSLAVEGADPDLGNPHLRQNKCLQTPIKCKKAPFVVGWSGVE